MPDDQTSADPIGDPIGSDGPAEAVPEVVSAPEPIVPEAASPAPAVSDAYRAEMHAVVNEIISLVEHVFAVMPGGGMLTARLDALRQRFTDLGAKL